MPMSHHSLLLLWFIVLSQDFIMAPLVLSSSPLFDLDNSASLGVVNGVLASPGRWTFMVSIRYNNSHSCGGSILNDDTILTAAHCNFPPTGNIKKAAIIQKMTVYIGNSKIVPINPQYIYTVKSMTIHPRFAQQWLGWAYDFAKGHDVAVVKLNQKIDFDRYHGQVSTVCLPHPNARVIGEKCLVLGWGRTSYSQKRGTVTVDLEQAEVPLIKADVCRQNYGAYNEEKMLCAGNLMKHTDGCNGDSGGPLVCPHADNPAEYLQFGIVSYGIDCGKVGGMYTRTQVFTEWIRENAEN